MKQIRKDFLAVEMNWKYLIYDWRSLDDFAGSHFISFIDNFIDH